MPFQVYVNLNLVYAFLSLLTENYILVLYIIYSIYSKTFLYSVNFNLVYDLKDWKYILV